RLLKCRSLSAHTPQRQQEALRREKFAIGRLAKAKNKVGCMFKHGRRNGRSFMRRERKTIW
ncbi:MAG: hypothetical protein ACPIOQ_78050, partial [Promethearchaeia archaeon]